MNISRLHEILAETTLQLRRGAEVEERIEPSGLRVKEIYGMPHESEAIPTLEKVDVAFITIGVDRKAAEERKAELLALLNEYPDPEELAGGPSYISVGATIGDQGAAFQLFALGKVLGLWDVITPKSLGIDDPETARRMAGAGYVMCTGYRKAA
jgi:hypothetical protein